MPDARLIQALSLLQAIAGDRPADTDSMLAGSMGLRLPPELERSRVMGTAETARFFDYSIPHFRRLVKAKKLPQPVKFGVRKDGWVLGDCIDAVAARQKASDSE
jgi:predicted DNA-binding transcriptional regulator AlpA